MELYVFDLEFNRLGVLDDFVKLSINRHYSNEGHLSLIIDGTAEVIDLLQKDRILVKADDAEHGYLIMHREYVDETSSQLHVEAPSINVLLNRRLVLGQQSFTGSIENVIKSFVQVNAVSPTNPKRVIPNLYISANHGIPGTTTESDSNVYLDSFLYELAKKHDVSWDILLDVYNKKLVFDVWQGVDRSTEQSENPFVIFSKDRENILKQNFVESDTDYKSVAIVAGEGEGTARTYVTVNDALSGFDRVELFVDARDMQSTYTDDNNTEVTLSPGEYQEILIERGNSKLAEYQKIVTFESEVDLYANGTYGVDYFLGDKVSVVNDDLGIILHTRIVAVAETYTKTGATLDVNFGSTIPSFIDKIKRAVK